jgi:hypothetical protein
MCPFCISTVLSVAAGTVTTGGVLTLVAFTRRLARYDESSSPHQPEEPKS